MSADTRPQGPAVRRRLRIYLGYAPGAGTTYALLSESRRRAEHGTELCLSANTVKTHLRHVYRKLGAHSRHEAVQRAQAIGLLAASSRRPWNAGPPYRI